MEVIQQQIRLDRPQTKASYSAFLCIIFIILEEGKCLFSYALRYYNKDKYPIHQLILVTLTEFLKCLFVISPFVYQFRTLLRIRLSLIFLPPALIYAITSNIFLYALTYVTPAVWIVLIQGKVIFTVAMYRFIFKKPVSKTQWLGAFLIVVAIAFSQLPSIMGTTFPVPVIALLLSMLNSLLAAGVSIYIEVLFKNDNRPFLEQQIQLYFFSTLTSALLSIYCTRLGDVATQWKDLTPRSLILLLLTIVMTSAQGVALASIMQHLDSIVKYYTANIANILTAILSAWCFPDKFTLNWSFGLSLAILVIAIFLYEKNHLNVLVSKHHI